MIDGLDYIGTCNCNGTNNTKYKYNEYKFYFTNTKFKVKKNGITVKGYSEIATLEAYIQETIPELLAGKQVQS